MPHHIAILPDDMLQTILSRLTEPLCGRCGVDRGDGTRLLRLPHPRTGLTSLFAPYQASDRSHSAIFEVQAVAPPNQRSWFMPEGEVLQDGQLLVMTPVDPAFLLIPILRQSCAVDGSPGNFRSAEDLFGDAASKCVELCDGSQADVEQLTCSLDDLLRLLSIACVESTMKQICDVKEITSDITVFRYSPEKTMKYLRTKVARLAQPRICEISSTITRNSAKDGLMEDGKEGLLESGRIRAACELLSQYLQSELYVSLLASYDFTVLDAHLHAVQDAVTKVAETHVPARKTKKGKAQPPEGSDKKRKAPARPSTGVEKLKKVNVKGMAKISSFFQKPAK